MTTPEGRVKAAFKRKMKDASRVYAFWPVQTGMGATTLDCLLCVNGKFVAVETKRKGKTFTPRQEHVAKAIKEATGLVYLVDDDNIDWVVKDILAKCFPTYGARQVKDPNGIVRYAQTKDGKICQ